MRLRLGVNWVDYHDAPCRERQHKAAQELLAHKPSWCDVWFLLLPEEAHGAPGSIRHLSRSFISGGRTLSFIKDILNALAGVGSEGDKIGFLNSDILVGDSFFTSIQDHWDAQAFTCHRIDIKAHEDIGGVRLGDDSTDILIVDWARWMELHGTMPDYLLGEPGWGYGVRIWLENQKLLCHDLDLGQCRHIRHVGEWRRGMTRGRMHNQALYRRERG